MNGTYRLDANGIPYRVEEKRVYVPVLLQHEGLLSRFNLYEYGV